LTSKFIIKLVLLSKLSGKQAENLEEINKYHAAGTGTNVCQVSHKTKEKHAIVISPEEVLMHWFLLTFKITPHLLPLISVI
jgi:hypothetical protein